jgi:hypothetical protein
MKMRKNDVVQLNRSVISTDVWAYIPLTEEEQAVVSVFNNGQGGSVFNGGRGVFYDWNWISLAIDPNDVVYVPSLRRVAIEPGRRFVVLKGRAKLAVRDGRTVADMLLLDPRTGDELHCRRMDFAVVK